MAPCHRVIVLYRAMVSKIPCNKGFTLIELVIATSLILLFLTATVLIVRPVEQLKKARDNKRISDLSLIDRVITEYKVDYGSYPDTTDTLRTSTTLPQGNSSLTNSTSGWIKQNLSAYTTKIPIDPINDETYYYKYIQNGFTYELNAKLEYNFEQATSDGGGDTTMYEIGNNLTLIVN